jgi:hypothetical protein
MIKKIRSMTYDELSNLLQIVGGVVLTVTFVVGLLTIWVQIKASNEKDVKAKEQEKIIAEINLKVEQESLKRIAAERALVELQKQVSWRYIDHDRFVEALKLGLKGKIEIVYSQENNESYLFANNIWMALEASGWDAEQPVTSKNSNKGDSKLPFDLREAGVIASNGPRLIVAVSENMAAKPYNGNTALSSLLLAFQKCDIETFQVIPHESIRPPKGVIRIIVNSRL